MTPPDPGYLQRLETLVNIDSGSRHLAGLSAVTGLLAGWCEQAGMTTTRHPVDVAGDPHGDVLVARIRGTGTGRILLAGHLDTVFPPGEAARRPFAIRGDRAYGPGVADDRGGLLAGLAAVQALQRDRRHTFAEIVYVATPDEEIGSPASRALLAELAGACDVALCLECARENGDLVNARKGMTDIQITLYGRAAHAGIEPHRGANAALAAARLTVALQRLNNTGRDVTVNVGVLRAGERPNVIADRADMLVDVRASDDDTFRRTLRQIEDLARARYVEGVSASVAFIAPTPPWHGTDAALLDAARAAGAATGVPVSFTGTGGCADANLIAGAGIPVLDGLGPVGGDDHSTDEWIDLDSVRPRIALLAELIATVPTGRSADSPSRAGLHGHPVR
ncbi:MULTISPECIES: M20/M25/M40 family metallo-hydrolase [unclassified Actinoplanes]|uniref:M20/M25/M40 family metallo-hydrolase n=1 Tax=unclassified Actinoplanes TaxID=2626549 RepID=UPI001E3D0778|nr:MULTISPECIES: M20/M25/M40 family metallo-hydrolase [unclassified Actinoplanes]